MPRSISAASFRNPALATAARFGQSRSMPANSMRSILKEGRWASGQRASNFSAQLVPVDVTMVFPSFNATRFLLSPL